MNNRPSYSNNKKPKYSVCRAQRPCCENDSFYRLTKHEKNLYFTWKGDIRHIIHEKMHTYTWKNSIFLSLKNLLVLVLPNYTRNHVFTYTTFPDLLNTVQFRALSIPSFLQFLLWISAYLRYLSIFSEGKPYPCRPKFLTREADVFTTWLKKGKVNSFTIVTLSGIITRRAG